jgi:hypothetical protein
LVYDQCSNGQTPKSVFRTLSDDTRRSENVTIDVDILAWGNAILEGDCLDAHSESLLCPFCEGERQSETLAIGSTPLSEACEPAQVKCGWNLFAAVATARPNSCTNFILGDEQ